MTSPQVTIVILNWNGWQDTLNCLVSLRNLKYPEYHIVLIDNGSTDESVQEILPHLDSRIHFITNKENLGFAKASNQGITYAIEDMHADYVWLLNNDTTVGNDSLSHMVQALRDPTAGMVQPRMLNLIDPWIIDSTGHIISWGRVYDRGAGEHNNEQYRTSHDIIGCSGAAGLYRVSMFKEIGILDESFVTGYEDSEFSWRAHNAGWKTAYVREAVVYHKRGASMQRMSAQNPRFVEHLSKQAPRPCMMHGTTLQKYQFVIHSAYTALVSEAGKRLGRNDYGAEPYVVSIREMIK